MKLLTYLFLPLTNLVLGKILPSEYSKPRVREENHGDVAINVGIVFGNRQGGGRNTASKFFQAGNTILDLNKLIAANLSSGNQETGSTLRLLFEGNSEMHLEGEDALSVWSFLQAKSN